MLLWQALLPRLNPWKMFSRYLPCRCSVSPNATKRRQSDLTSYFTVSDLWEAIPNRDRTKFTRGTSILQYLSRATSWRWHRAEPRGTATQVLGKCQARQQPLPGLSPVKARGHKGHCTSGQPPQMLLYGETFPVHCPPSLHPQERLTSASLPESGLPARFGITLATAKGRM